MNERIKKLAEQADNYAKQTVHYYQGQFDGLTWEGKIKQVRDTKFAKLIIKDQQRTWVGLTDKEILADDVLRYYFGLNGGAGPVSKSGRKIFDALEAKLKEKNT